MQGLGYKEVVEYLEQKITKDEMIEKIKMSYKILDREKLQALADEIK